MPARVAYRHTHWVGADSRNRENIGIFDINAINNGTGWCAVDDWEKTLVPWLLESIEPKANGGWYITHSVEVARPASQGALT